MTEMLSRYSEAQRLVIDRYWDVVRWTRKHGKISDKIKLAEMDYWSKFEPDIVIIALETHVARYPKVRENYTRGIMRNMAEQKAMGVGSAPESSPKPAFRRNRFINYTQRTDVDFEAIEYLERLKITGELDARRSELKNDPKYAKYL